MKKLLPNMTKKWKQFTAMLTLAAVLTAATGCGGSTESSTASDSVKDTTAAADSSSEQEGDLNQATELRIATQPVPAYLPLWLTNEKGWLEEALKEAGYENVKVTFTEFESGPPENESFAAGQQDIGVMGNVPSIGGLAAGQKRTFIGISENGEKTEAILVPPDSDIKSVADLKGKKIGLVVGSIVQNLLYNLLKEEGLTLDDVEQLNLATGEQLEALATGQVDAIATWQPMIAQIENEGVGKVLADGSGGVFLAENTIFAQDDYLAENPDIVRIVMEQYARGAKEVKDNLDQYAKDYADKYGLTEELLKAALVDAQFPIAIEDVDVEDLQGTADFLYEQGLIKTEVNVSEHTNNSFNDAVK